MAKKLKTAAGSKKKSAALKKKTTTKMKVIKKVAKKVPAKRKAKKVLPIPKGYSSVTAYLIMSDAAKAIDFYKKTLAAKEVKRMARPDGKVGHAELKIGDSKIMLADECPEMNVYSPEANGNSSISLHLYVKDVDAVVKKAVHAGAKLLMPVENMFYGDRSGTFEDPFGYKWHVSTHVEDVTPAQMKKRAAEAFSKM
jgi:PhnB protein